MYSITDRVSFHVARELLEDLANLGDIICPVLLMANKLDLHHHRKVSACPLFRKKRFLVNLKTERNASKFAMFMEKENPRSFFRFSFRATFIFPL